ncbi:condensation domain-containing protein [Embleya sp. NPDC050493]|uniref:condensation domain-containing protein n=1 Tax=Embleya sp. NPDC050493 TaxID=3363989 RepID=UPI00378B7083
MTDQPLDAQQIESVERRVRTAVLDQDGVLDCAVVFNEADPAAAGARACVRCGISAAYPGLRFDPDGVCSLCARYAAHRSAMHAYFRDPQELAPRLREAARGRGSHYDCLLLFSGGKDSTYVLYQLVGLGLRVMTFTFDNGFISRTALRNVETVTAELGIEHVTATHADQKRIFLNSLQEHKSVCNGCFRSLLDLSTELAHQRDIPTVVTGLSRGQIMDERLSWFHEQGIFDVAEIEEKLRLGREVYHQAAGTVDAAAVNAVQVVDYFRYSAVTKEEVRAFLRERSSFWAQPTDTGFCSSNCMINDVGTYVHAAERGFHNYEAPTRWEVRLGHLDVAEADAELRAPVETAQVKRMLARIGYPDPADADRTGARLAVYYVADRSASSDRLAAAVADALPPALVPAQWVQVAEIPRVAGAVDQWALRGMHRPKAPGSRGGGVTADADSDRSVAVRPVQRRILDRDPGRAAHRARTLFLTSESGFPVTDLKRVWLQLLLHHEALRLRFGHGDQGWRQSRGGLGGAVHVSRVDLTGQDPGAQGQVLRRLTDRMRARLHVDRGPLLRAAVVDRGTRPAGLLIVVHELAADVESWRVLLADLALGLGQLQAGSEVRLPPAASFLDHPAEPAGVEDEAGPEVAGAGCVLPGSPAPEPIAEEPLEARCPVRAATARDVAAAIAHVLVEEFGGGRLVADVLDHTTRRPAARVIGPLAEADRWVVTPLARGASVVRVARAAEPARVRYEHFGDPAAALLPSGVAWTLRDTVWRDFAGPGHPGDTDATITGVVDAGELVLTWWCPASVGTRLAAAHIPERVARRLIGEQAG